MSNVTEHAFNTIRELVLNDHFQQGERLTEVDLVRLTGASRTPVREAIRRLEAEGLVEVSPNRGARVASWTTSNLNEVFALRALLEGYAAQIAATRVSEEDLENFKDLADQMDVHAAADTPADLDAIALLNDEFHRAILRSASNELLGGVIRSISHTPLITRTFRRYDESALKRSMTQHRDLISAFEAGDGVWASAVMQAHILSARGALDAQASGASEQTEA